MLSNYKSGNGRNTYSKFPIERPNMYPTDLAINPRQWHEIPKPEENIKEGDKALEQTTLLPIVYRDTRSRVRRDQMGKHHFPSPEHHSGPPIDYSTDAIIYVTVVVVFYAAIIILLLTTNFRRKRSNTSTSGQSSSKHGDGSSNSRKHWLFFNPISGEAQQASKKESQHFIHRQDAETV